MRRLLLSATLVLSACATAPQQPVATPTAPSPHIRSNVLGMTAAELIDRFGVPALQVREGSGTKFQFRNRLCVLDAYLYPPPDARGAERVTHVDARDRAGTDVDQRSCIAAFQRA